MDKQQAFTSRESSAVLQERKTLESAQNFPLPVPQSVFEAIDNAVRQALKRRFSKSEGPDEITSRRMDNLTAKASPKESKLLVDQKVFETFMQAIAEALSLVSTSPASKKNSSDSSIDQSVVQNIDQAIKDALDRRISVSQPKLDLVPKTPLSILGSPNLAPQIDEPVIRAIDQVVKNSLRQIFSKSKFKQTENLPTVDEALVTEAVDQAVRNSLSVRLSKKPLSTAEPNDALLPKPFLEAIGEEVKSVLVRELTRVGLYPTNARKTASVGPQPTSERPVIQFGSYPVKVGSIASVERNSTDKLTTAPVGPQPTDERPNAPVRDRTTTEASTAPTVLFGSLDSAHLVTVDPVVEHALRYKMKKRSSVPQKVDQTTLPLSDAPDVDNSEQRNDKKPPPLPDQSPVSSTEDSRIADEKRKSLRSHSALTDERKRTDSAIQHQKEVREESAQKSVEKKAHNLPKEKEKESDIGSATEEDVNVRIRTLLLRPKESNTSSNEADDHTTKIESAIPINVERFPSDAVLVTFETEEEAERFRKAIAKSDQIEVRDGESFPRQVWILDVEKGVNEEDLYSIIQATFNESPTKIKFSKYPDNSDLRVAHIEVSSSLFKRIQASPSVQIGGNTHDIDTSLEVRRCSRCSLLGHSETKCKQTPQPSRSAVSEALVCYDCKNYNAVLRKLIGVRRATDRHRKFNHPTDDKTCLTKTILNEQSRTLKQKTPYLDEGENESRRGLSEQSASNDAATAGN